MKDDLSISSQIASHGMKAQATRLRVISENLANADSTSETPGGDPYPTHPGADEKGYVLTPNVNPLVEMMDMREAQRSYEANMDVISTSRQMVAKTLELLK